ncbi:MAG: hypothetical protein MUP63_03380, partial [Candidatus Nanohaloarchaeota archaeon QJJ-7]|nr:hypothetical protein [Candidatus Nanohaloarchaeota archaeon QJJ-7]
LTDVNKKKGRAKNHGVRSVPTTIIDGPELEQKMGFTGVMKEDKLETAIKVAAGEVPEEELGSGSITSKLKSTIFG